MTSDELFDLFRSDVVDTALPYLWSDDDVWSYMDDAYRQFVRLTGGIPDVSSDLTQIPVVMGEPIAEVSPLILKFRTARLLSMGRMLDIVNETDVPRYRTEDYGLIWGLGIDASPGSVRAMVIGQDRNNRRGLVRWVRVPLVDDVCQLSIYRLPLDRVATGFDFYEIGEEHHVNLLTWMKARAYGKQDAETFDLARRTAFEQQFRAYCLESKFEADRYKSKVNIIDYGGI